MAENCKKIASCGAIPCHNLFYAYVLRAIPGNHSVNQSVALAS